MIKYNLFRVEDLFARSFVVAKQLKINWQAFQEKLLRSDFLIFVEEERFDEFMESYKENLCSLLGVADFNEDSSKFVYDDAYWAGKMLFQLSRNLNTSISRILIKLSIEELLGLYKVYHEMNISELEEYFFEKDNKSSVLNCLSKKYSVSLKQLSEKLNINIETIRNYSRNDSYLENASFKNIYSIAKYFNVPVDLFAKKPIQERI